MINLNDLFLFVQAVEAGSFSEGARRLGIPKSTISKRIGELEAQLGARLIHRTSRSFSLSDAGRDFFNHARGALIEAEAAENIVRSRLAEPSGTVRITASIPTTQFYLADCLPVLARKYPKINLEMYASDRFVDLVQEGYDLAIRSHFAPLPDSDLVQKQLMTEPIFVVASPGYLSAHGQPVSPQDVSSHYGLLSASGAEIWHLVSDSGAEVKTKPIRRMLANESITLIKAAIADMGLTCLPSSICESAIKHGELIRVLPDWSAGMVTTTLLMPHRRGQLPSVRAVVDFFSNDMRKGGE
ncbi:LysR substrate-binding domain-containing protein [Phyllobacterium sp. YR531]|uniref:LysR substrate-binding domain-containing protein n=1 Tax=Phyllobacterium sp. YR531 TaxID=1144343 RepID=UPI00026F86A7|nr:LysR substrate-binding domain-containing protein [Phyllobacterium sp. YR531]EJN06355.1 transcriptional regulator [Phyllobacterium sp. YR531]